MEGERRGREGGGERGEERGRLKEEGRERQKDTWISSPRSDVISPNSAGRFVKLLLLISRIARVVSCVMAGERSESLLLERSRWVREGRVKSSVGRVVILESQTKKRKRKKMGREVGRGSDRGKRGERIHNLHLVREFAVNPGY